MLPKRGAGAEAISGPYFVSVNRLVRRITKSPSAADAFLVSSKHECLEWEILEVVFHSDCRLVQAVRGVRKRDKWALELVIAFVRYFNRHIKR